MVRAFWILAPLVLLTSPRLASADEAGSSDSTNAIGLFRQLDENNDGQLTRAEIPDDRRSLFDRLLRIGDDNSDDKLNAEEFAGALTGGRSERGPSPQPKRPGKPNSDRRGPGQLFERFDANGDGKVELAEVPEPARERLSKLFARVDKDGDGAVTRREFAKARGGSKPPKRDSKKPGDAAKAPKPQSGRDAGQLFRRMDRNADGQLSVAEVPEERRKMLERLIQRGDKDGDESLSLREFTAVFGKRRPSQSPTRDAKKRKPDAAKPPGLFGAIDADRDGQLDSDEISAAADAIRKLDKNGDGSVNAREVLAGARRKGKKKNQ